MSRRKVEQDKAGRREAARDIARQGPAVIATVVANPEADTLVQDMLRQLVASPPRWLPRARWVR